MTRRRRAECRDRGRRDDCESSEGAGAAQARGNRPDTNAMTMIVVPNPNRLYVQPRPIKRVVVSTYQSTSGKGKSAMDELFNQTKGIYMNQPEKDNQEVFTKPIAFNVIPQVDAFQPSGYTKEEEKMQNEARRLSDLVKEINAFPDHDIYFCNPQPEYEALYHNLWLQGVPSHPQFLEVSQAFFRAVGLPLESLMSIEPIAVTSSANFCVESVASLTRAKPLPASRLVSATLCDACAALCATCWQVTVI